MTKSIIGFKSGSSLEFESFDLKDIIEAFKGGGKIFYNYKEDTAIVLAEIEFIIPKEEK